MLELKAATRLRISDSPIKGLIFLCGYQGRGVALCLCGSRNSPVFVFDDEASAYHAARDWFGEQNDGFIETEKIDLAAKPPELLRFSESLPLILAAL